MSEDCPLSREPDIFSTQNWPLNLLRGSSCVGFWKMAAAMAVYISSDLPKVELLSFNLNLSSHVIKTRVIQDSRDYGERYWVDSDAITLTNCLGQVDSSDRNGF